MLPLIEKSSSVRENIHFSTSNLDHSVSKGTLFTRQRKDQVRKLERSPVAFSPCDWSQPISQSSFSSSIKLVVLGWIEPWSADRDWGFPGCHVPWRDSSGSLVRADFSSFFEHHMVWMLRLNTLIFTGQFAVLPTTSGKFSHSDWLLGSSFLFYRSCLVQ